MAFILMQDPELPTCAPQDEKSGKGMEKWADGPGAQAPPGALDVPCNVWELGREKRLNRWLDVVGLPGRGDKAGFLADLADRFLAGFDW